jgi:hypothetical protein
MNFLFILILIDIGYGLGQRHLSVTSHNHKTAQWWVGKIPVFVPINIRNEQYWEAGNNAKGTIVVFTIFDAMDHKGMEQFLSGSL